MIYCKDTGETVDTYKEYLYTEHWRKLRSVVYERYKHRCVECQKELPLDFLNVHHKTYANVGDEQMEDLILVCSRCHAKLHGITEIKPQKKTKRIKKKAKRKPKKNKTKKQDQKKRQGGVWNEKYKRMEYPVKR